MGFETPNELHKKSLLETLQEKFPGASSVHSIMGNVKSEENMKTFFDTYVEFAKNDGVENPEEVVISNIKYIVGQFSDKNVAKKWGEFLLKK